MSEEHAVAIDALWCNSRGLTLLEKNIVLAYIIGRYLHAPDNERFLTIYREAIERATSIKESAESVGRTCKESKSL